MAIQWTTLNILILSAAVLAIVSLIIGLVAIVSTAGLNRKFKRYKGIHSTADLEQVYRDTVQQTDRLRAQISTLELEISELKLRLERKISTAQILRYNAFSDTGSDLSYTVALLDDHKDGVVLSSIYGRDESRTYGKPVSDGTSRYPLTKEEQEIIQK